MSLAEKLKMTPEEQASWRKKLDVLKEFATTFKLNTAEMIGGKAIYFQEPFFLSLTLKEILSKEYATELRCGCLLDYQWSIPFKEIIRKKIVSLGEGKDIFNKDLTRSEWCEFYDMLIERDTDRTSDTHPPLDKVSAGSLFNYMSNIMDDKIELVYSLVDYFGDDYMNYIPEHVLGDTLTKIFTGKDTGKILDFIDFIIKKFPNFHNYVPILFNENLDAETRAKIMKSTYRQKDLPQYKEFLRNNRSHLDILDTFIDITIMNNNRVTEKDANFLKLIVYVYVTNGGAWTYDRLTKEKCVGLKEFTEKYKRYFLDPKFILDLYTIGVSSLRNETYYRREEYDRFISIILSSYDVNDVLDAFSSPSLGDKKTTARLSKTFAAATSAISNIFHGKFGDNEDTNRKLVRFYCSRMEFTSLLDDLSAAGIDASKYADILAEYANAYFDINSKNLVSNNAHKPEANKLFCNEAIAGLDNMNYGSEAAYNLLGFSSEELKNSVSSGYMLYVNNLHDIVLGIYEALAAKGFSHNVAKSFYKVYLKRYLNDGPFSASIVDIPTLMSDKYTKFVSYSYWATSNSTLVVDAYSAILKRIAALVEPTAEALGDEFPESEKSEILDQLNQIETNVNLLCAI